MVKWIGFVAAFLTTTSFIPQTIKIIDTGKTEDISTAMYAMLVGGILLWLVYGLKKKDWPLILANTVTLIFAGTVLFLKLFY